MAFETGWGWGKAVSLLADGRAGQIDSKRSSRVALQTLGVRFVTWLNSGLAGR